MASAPLSQQLNELLSKYGFTMDNAPVAAMRIMSGELLEMILNQETNQEKLDRILARIEGILKEEILHQEDQEAKPPTSTSPEQLLEQVEQEPHMPSEPTAAPQPSSQRNRFEEEELQARLDEAANRRFEQEVRQQRKKQREEAERTKAFEMVQHFVAKYMDSRGPAKECKEKGKVWVKAYCRGKAKDPETGEQVLPPWRKKQLRKQQEQLRQQERQAAEAWQAAEQERRVLEQEARQVEAGNPNPATYRPSRRPQPPRQQQAPPPPTQPTPTPTPTPTPIEPPPRSFALTIELAVNEQAHRLVMDAKERNYFGADWQERMNITLTLGHPDAPPSEIRKLVQKAIEKELNLLRRRTTRRTRDS
jgi:hypothetical protein